MHSLSISDVDLREVEDDTNENETSFEKKGETDVAANLSFFKLSDYAGSILLFTHFAFFLFFGWLFYRYHQYMNGSLTFTRPYTFSFAGVAILYLARGAFLLRNWKRYGTKYTVQLGTKWKRRKEPKRSSIRGLDLCTNVWLFRKKFSMRGKYFLWKLYTFEIIQLVNQIVNFYSVYLCTAPIEITSGLGFLVCAASLNSIYLTQNP